MIAGIIITILPYPLDDTVVSSIATLPLVTGISYLVAGFVQAAQHQTAYFQQSIVLWLAGMGAGPVAIIWLRRTHGQTASAILFFTLLYSACIGAFFFFTVHNALGIQDGSRYSCFLDEVSSSIFSEQSMKVLNGFVVGVVVLVVVASAITNCVYKKNRSGRFRGVLASQPEISTKWEWFIVVSVVLFETLIAALVTVTVRRFNDFDTQPTQVGWTFGRLVPFAMLVLPLVYFVKTIFAGEATKAAQAQVAQLREERV